MTAPLAHGSTFAGYRIEALIGRGGMGLVYRATDLSLERPVALKLIAPEFAGDERFRARFLKEPRLAASLDHPHVVPIFEAGERDGRLYLAMRYVEGRDLRAIVEAEGRLEPERAISILAQVAGALDAAHRRGLVHRDVKPGNVLLDGDDHAYLSDFGITTQEGGTSADSSGTLEYLAPEQIRGEPVDGRTDAYALACVLYECLVGEPPFRRATQAETLWAHLRDEPPPLRAHPALDPVLRKALAKDKGERYASCSAVIDAARVALGRGTSARPRRVRGRAIVAAGALVLIGAIATAVLPAGGREPQPHAAAATGDLLVAIDPANNRIAERATVGGTPTSVSVGGGAVWTLNGDDRTISRLDLKTRAVRNFAVSTAPVDLAADTDALWVAGVAPTRAKPTLAELNATAANVTRVDPVSATARGTTTLATPTKPAVSPTAGRHIAIGGGAVWTIGRNSWVHRLDLETGRLTTRRSFQAEMVAAGDGQVWLFDRRGRAVRLDGGSGRAIARVRLPVHWIDALAVDEHGVWLTDSSQGRLWRVDPERLAVRAIKLPEGGDSVAAGAGAVWVANSVFGTVSRIDPASNRVTATMPVGGTPRGIAVGAGRVWVSVAGVARATPATAGLKANARVKALPAPPCSSVLTDGSGDPDLLIAADFPLGATTGATLPMTKAVAFVLRERHFRAGRFTIGYQSCDTANATTGLVDFAKCRQNARAYVKNPAVIGVVGPFQSPCAREMIPILNRAGDEQPALVSPTNSDPDLVRRKPVAPGDMPDKLYPTGQRGYARVSPSDDYDAAAGAILANRLGRGRAFFLQDRDFSADGPMWSWFRRAADRIGLRIIGKATWTAKDTNYRAVAERVRVSGARAVYINSSIPANLGRLLKDLRAAVGPDVAIIGTLGFAPVAQLFADAGPAARGVFITAPGLTPDGLGSTGRRFVRGFSATQEGGNVSNLDVYAAAATEVLLDAIARSDGTRPSVVHALTHARLPDSVLGPLALASTGEPIAQPITVLRAEHGGGRADIVQGLDGAVAVDVITPPADLVGGQPHG